MTRLFLTAALLFSVSGTTALAAETYEVTLQDGTISTIEIDVNVGDIVQIVHNDEDGVHALYLEDTVHSFDLSDMKHGNHFDLELKHAGTLTVQCHQMDHMTLVINVTE